MREIKFRAWIVEDEFMIHSDRLCFEQFLPLKNLLNDNNDIQKVMQYTGLKDKNDVDIYEGDIVRVIDDIGYYGMGIAIFCLGSFCFEWIDDSEANIEPIVTIKKINNNQELEVIGNIYENKELLN